MKYSDWQLDRVRDALRTCYQYTYIDDLDYYGVVEGSDDPRKTAKIKEKRQKMIRTMSWADIREAIAVRTGIEIGANMKLGSERIRQFTEGFKVKGGRRRFPVLQESWLDAVVSFVIDQKMLLPSELEDHTPDVYASLRLTEYLEIINRNDSLRIKPGCLTGKFYNRVVQDKEFIVSDLDFQTYSDKVPIQVVVTEIIYDLDAVDLYDEWSPQEKIDEQCFYYKYIGWALITPEANLLFFLKEESYTANRYYHTVASDFNVTLGKPSQFLALFKSGRPLSTKYDPENETVDKITDQISTCLSDYLQVFTR